MFIADFHIHSKYSRATSKDCVPELLDFWARRKGIGVIGTGDFTHRAWREELKEKLVPSGDGLYTLKKEFHQEDEVAGADLRPQFIVTGEISSIYKKNGKVRKVHNLIILPGLEHAEAISRRLEAIGNTIPTVGPSWALTVKFAGDMLEICPEPSLYPPISGPSFFSLWSISALDHIEECFEDLPAVYMPWKRASPRILP